MLNLYCVNFTGLYPVGAVAVVWARDRGQARKLFLAKLEQEMSYLYEKNKDIGLDSFVQLDLEQRVHILANGDY